MISWNFFISRINRLQNFVRKVQQKLSPEFLIKCCKTSWTSKEKWGYKKYLLISAKMLKLWSRATFVNISKWSSLSISQTHKSTSHKKFNQMLFYFHRWNHISSKKKCQINSLFCNMGLWLSISKIRICITSSRINYLNSSNRIKSAINWILCLDAHRDFCTKKTQINFVLFYLDDLWIVLILHHR